MRIAVAVAVAIVDAVVVALALPVAAIALAVVAVALAAVLVVAEADVFVGGDSRRCGWVTSCCVVVRLLAAREWVGWWAGCCFVVGYSCPLLRDFRAETRLTVYRPVYIRMQIRSGLARFLPRLTIAIFLSNVMHFKSFSEFFVER